jgi:hypothetical protein
LESKRVGEDKTGAVRLVNAGSEIAGAAIGGALGFFAGGPIGAAFGSAGGTAIGMVLKHIGGEVSERLLSEREKVRVGGVLALVAVEVERRFAKGESLRTDGFFSPSQSSRSDADEVVESLLLKSQREAEERKLPYMANLIAGIAFDSAVSAPMAHQLLKIAEQLTFRQLCLIRIAAVSGSLGLKQGDYRSHGAFSKDLYQVLHECHDLYVRGFISFGGAASFGLTDVIPAAMKVQGIGTDLYRLMKLGEIPEDPLWPVIVQLQ